MLALQSPHVDLQLHGWRTTTGMVLREPATASVEYTPALARCCGVHAACMAGHEHRMVVVTIDARRVAAVRSEASRLSATCECPLSHEAI